MQMKEHTTSRIVRGKDIALIVVNALVNDSMWFAFEPLPDDQYNIRVKLDVAHRLDQAIQEADSMPDQDQIAEFLADRMIPSGSLALEEIPDKLAQYGLMNPVAFAAEMRERMELQGGD